MTHAFPTRRSSDLFGERVEVIYGANAIQGVGATGGVINYVTTTAPENGDWLNRVTLEGSTDDFEDHGFHYKLAALTARKLGAFDFVVGATHELTDLFYDGNGKPVGVDTTQGDIMDTKGWSLFTKLDRKSVVMGKRVSVSVDLGGRRII